MSKFLNLGEKIKTTQMRKTGSLFRTRVSATVTCVGQRLQGRQGGEVGKGREGKAEASGALAGGCCHGKLEAA